MLQAQSIQSNSTEKGEKPENKDEIILTYHDFYGKQMAIMKEEHIRMLYAVAALNLELKAELKFPFESKPIIHDINGVNAEIEREVKEGLMEEFPKNSGIKWEWRKEESTIRATGLEKDHLDLSDFRKLLFEPPSDYFQGRKNGCYIIKWFCYFASKKDPNKVTHLAVPYELQEEGWRELEAFLQTNHSLQYIYNRDGEQIPFIKEKFAEKFYDIIFYLASNRVRNANGPVDLSHLYIFLISTKQLTSLFQLISIKGITQLDLNHNGLQHEACKYNIAEFLKQSPPLKRLNLANNQIIKVGLNYLLYALKANQFLEWVDLSNNYLELKKSELKETMAAFKKESKQTNNFRCLIDISGNLLSEDCEEEFKEVVIPVQANDLVEQLSIIDFAIRRATEKQWSSPNAKNERLLEELIKKYDFLSKHVKYNNSLRPFSTSSIFSKALNEKKETKKDDPRETKYMQYGFFLTRPITIKSLIDENLRISSTEWVVAFTCEKGREHAMIYMEGMRSSGQRFLERYHIQAEGTIGVAHVSSDAINVMNFKRKQYYFKTFSIDDVQGMTLKRSVNAQEPKEIAFSKYCPSSSKGTTNCVGWAIEQLGGIGIKIEESALGLPSRTAMGAACSIM